MKLTLALIAFLALAALEGANADSEAPSSMYKAREDQSYQYQYYISDTERNWHMAKIDCIKRGLSLISIKTSEENEELKKVLSDRPYDWFWSSLTDAGSLGSWYWDSNGAAVTFSNWEASKPSQTGRPQCAELRGNAARLWNNLNCDLEAKYICEGYLPR